MKTEPDIDTLEDSKPDETRAERELRKSKIASIVKRRMFLLIAFLSALTGVVKFGLGEKFWPLWLLESRTTIAGILLFIVVFLVLLSPIIVEFSKDPRRFSGSNTPPYLRG